MYIQNYMNDGACAPARAVLAILSSYSIEDSYCAKRNDYKCKVSVSRWENGREQGYVTMLAVGDKQLNIAFFEHRNSDDICAVMWEQYTINAPSIDTAIFGNVYKTKDDVSKSVGYNEHYLMAEWIREQFDSFYEMHKSCNNSVER